MNEIFNKLQVDLKLMNISDFRMLTLLKDGTLTIVGSFDFGYYHEIEIRFFETTFISCPVNFCDAKFRIATYDECEKIKPILFDGINDLIVCIVIDEEFDESPVKYFIVAKEMEYRVGTVYYYKKENLLEGEKIADWVR